MGIMAWAKVIGVGILLSVVLFLKHQYDDSVSTKRVDAALVAERKVEAPKLATAKADLTKANQTIAKINSDAQIAKAKYLKEANEKTIQYNAVLAVNKKLFSDFNAALLTKSELSERLRDIESQYSSIGISTSNSGFTKRLGAAYAECEQDVSALLLTASEQNERAAKAEAGIRALMK